MRIPETEDARNNPCEDCGAAVSEGKEGCQRLFQEVLVREYSDYRYAKNHRLMVDAYSLQHPDSYMRSGKSFAAHLTGICSALEYEDGSAINRAVQSWLSGARMIDKPAQLPARRGDLTIIYIHSATNAEEHNKRVRDWACSVWAAWSDYHNLARQWISEATSK
jgi:hypothetical protein